MSRTYYMHTINGKPAFFDGDQIVFAMFYGKASPLVDSLAQIKREQRQCREYRAGQGWDGGGNMFKYGHLRFRLPESHDE